MSLPLPLSILPHQGLLADLLRRLWRRRPRTAPVLLLGLDNAGKTALLRRLTGGGFAAAAPTVGFDVKSMLVAEGGGRQTGPGLRLDVFDVGGGAALRPYWLSFPGRRPDAVAFCADASDRRRLGEAAAELLELLSDDRLAGAPLLVFATKQDAGGAMAPGDVAEALGLGASAARGRAWRMQGCSAKEGYGVEEGMSWLVEQLLGGGGGGGGGRGGGGGGAGGRGGRGVGGAEA